jgi:putative ABC transport system ATP-binding protein
MGNVLVPALCGASFDVKEDESLTIFGPSGSGKSALLHLMGGLDCQDEGEILIDDSDILKLNSVEALRYE